MRHLVELRNDLTRRAGDAHEQGDMKKAQTFLEISREVEKAMRQDIRALQPVLVDAEASLMLELANVLHGRHRRPWTKAARHHDDRSTLHLYARVLVSRLRKIRNLGSV